MVTDLSRFWAVFLLGREVRDLDEVRRRIEDTEPKHLRSVLLAHFDIFLAFIEDTDFVLATAEAEVAEAFLQAVEH